MGANTRPGNKLFLCIALSDYRRNHWRLFRITEISSHSRSAQTPGPRNPDVANHRRRNALIFRAQSPKIWQWWGTEFGNRRDGIWKSKASDWRTEGMGSSKRWHSLGESAPDKMESSWRMERAEDITGHGADKSLGNALYRTYGSASHQS
jgi:hypothetical protein